MIAYPLLLWAVFFIGGNALNIAMMFANIDFYGSMSWAGFSNFKNFITSVFDPSADNLLGVSFMNSIKMYVINFAISMPLYLTFSYAIYKKCFGHRLWRFLMMLPSIIPGFVYALIFKRFVMGPVAGLIGIDSPLRDENFSFGLILFYSIWVSFGFNMLVYSNAMKEIDNSIVESAKIDGVKGMWQEMRYILLPLIYPTLTTFIVVGVGGFLMQSGPLITFYLYNAPGYVYTSGYYFTVRVFNATNETQYPMLAAGGMLITLIAFPLTLLARWAMEKYGPSVD